MYIETIYCKFTYSNMYISIYLKKKHIYIYYIILNIICYRRLGKFIVKRNLYMHQNKRHCDEQFLFSLRSFGTPKRVHPEKWRFGTPKWRFGRWFSFSIWCLSCSILIFRGVSKEKNPFHESMFTFCIWFFVFLSAQPSQNGRLFLGGVAYTNIKHNHDSAACKYGLLWYLLIKWNCNLLHLSGIGCDDWSLTGFSNNFTWGPLPPPRS